TPSKIARTLHLPLSDLRADVAHASQLPSRHSPAAHYTRADLDGVCPALCVPDRDPGRRLDLVEPGLRRLGRSAFQPPGGDRLCYPGSYHVALELGVQRYHYALVAAVRQGGRWHPDTLRCRYLDCRHSADHRVGDCRGSNDSPSLAAVMPKMKRFAWARSAFWRIRHGHPTRAGDSSPDCPRKNRNG